MDSTINLERNVFDRIRLAVPVAESSINRPAVMEERNRLAREIHDTLAQAFAGILLQLENVPVRVIARGQLNSDAAERVARAKHLAKCGLEDSRRMLLGLRPKSLDGASLVKALKALAQQCAGESHIVCRFRFTGQKTDLSPEIQDELYRIAQEALCNVRKHSRATLVSILLSYESDMIVLTVRDNGQGIDAERPKAAGEGFGLSSMRERALRIGGSMEINSGPQEGTEIKVLVLPPAIGSKKVIRKASSLVHGSRSDDSPARHGNRMSLAQTVT